MDSLSISGSKPQLEDREHLGAETDYQEREAMKGHDTNDERTGKTSYWVL